MQMDFYLQDFYMKLHPSDDASKFQQVFSRVDQDRNAKIDVYEFMAFVDRELAVPFQTADQHRSGYLNRAQLKSALVKMGHRVTDESFRVFLLATKLESNEARAIDFEHFLEICMTGITEMYRTFVQDKNYHEQSVIESEDASEQQTQSKAETSTKPPVANDVLPIAELRSQYKSAKDRRYIPLSLFRRSTSPCFASTVPRFEKQSKTVTPGPGQYELKTSGIGRLDKSDYMAPVQPKRSSSPNPSKANSRSSTPVDGMQSSHLLSISNQSEQIMTQDMLPIRPTSSFASRSKRASDSKRSQTNEFVGPGTYQPELYRPKSASLAPFGRSPSSYGVKDSMQSSTTPSSPGAHNDSIAGRQSAANAPPQQYADSKPKSRPSSAFASTVPRFPPKKSPAIDFRGVQENTRVHLDKSGAPVPGFVCTSQGSQFGLSNRTAREVVVNCKDSVHIVRTFYVNGPSNYN
eukprot:TRINITY_DN6279_c0_g1_i10.p1 TRINITY_DN6279_c0_g1~~TRINITY_DN6279_c0_g1_i10.p1  ORF type:complete len:463 (+),score=87.67 TRINITY_DN6279_c0_g1_i10:89-1477(+)